MEGVVVAIKGPVVDIDFENYLPDINEAIEINYDVEGTTQRLICEVAAHLGDNRVRTIAMDASDGIKRGQSVKALGNPIQVPVGEEVLGRIFDVIGNTIDEGEELQAKQKWSIHRQPPNFEDQSTKTEAFEKQIISLKAHSEGVRTSLYEGENILDGIREQSEMIMKQMVLSSKKMDELESKNSGLHDIYSTVKDLVKDIENIKADYVKSQSQLSMIAQDMKISEAEQIEAMKKQIESLGKILTQKIDDSLEKLHEHYHIAGEDITQSVQMLAKKAQLQKGYTELDS
jgi:archaellum component FlaC